MTIWKNSTSVFFLFGGDDDKTLHHQIRLTRGGIQSVVKQSLANELNVIVKAPTEDLNIDENGRTFICDNDILAEMWHSGIEVDEPGEWIYFRPGGEEDDEDVGNV